MAGEIGFDEGGVLQAMFSRSFYKTTVTEFDRNRKGEVIRQRVSDYDISVGEVVVAGIISGTITMAVFSVKAVNDLYDKLSSLSDEEKLNYLFSVFGAFGLPQLRLNTNIVRAKAERQSIVQALAYQVALAHEQEQRELAERTAQAEAARLALEEMNRMSEAARRHLEAWEEEQRRAEELERQRREALGE